MDRSEVLAFLNANPSCSLATVDAGKPRVRGMMMYRADDSGILFHTGGKKDLIAQLKANPHVELCFVDEKSLTQVRVSGVAEFLDDRKLKEEIADKRPFLKPWIEQYGWDVLSVIRVKDGVATVWTMATNLAPKTYVKL